VSILSTERLGHSFHDRWLFRNLHFGLQKGERVALVGANGVGKSSLLRILAGILEPIEGIVVRERGVRVGFLPQEPTFDGFVTIRDFIDNGASEQLLLIRAYEALVADPGADPKAVSALTDRITAADAWSYEHRIRTLLSRFQFTDYDQRIADLSGGQRKRLALAKLLMDEPDIYILDEPTNHLDIETIEWLENLLTTGQKTILLVTHDRYFLDTVCNQLRELDRGEVTTYQGNYQYYLERKAEAEENAQEQWLRNRNLLRRELEWMRRQPQARGTKSKARIDAFYELQEKAKRQGSKQVLQLRVDMSRQGSKILELHDVGKRFGGREVIREFSYIFKKGDRIGLAGRNGSGKSTFLNLITGMLRPDSGSISVGETTVFGYYRQEGLTLPREERVIDVVKRVAEYIPLANGENLTASQLLTKFLFPPEKQFSLVSKLSGGERKRLQLMRVLMSNPNFLILDEPANDLDIDTLQVLEAFLVDFEGVLVLVSHDRYLLDRLTDQLFIFEGDGHIRIYNGNYADYKLEREEALLREKPTELPKSAEKPGKPEQKVKLSFKELREYETLNNEIPTLEQQIAVLTAALNQTTDHIEITHIAAELERLNKELDKKIERWLALAEYA